MRRMALAAVAVSICGNVFAARTLEPIESAYELRLIHVVWPASTLGSLIVKPCPECDEVTLFVDGETTYSVVGQAPITLTDFEVVAGQLRASQGEEASVGVFYEPKSKRVTRVVLYPAG